MKGYFRFFLLVIIGTLVVFAGCKKTDSNSVPVLATANVNKVAFTTAECGGTITADGGAAITARGVCWDTLSNPTVAKNKTTDSIGAGTFTSKLTLLSPNKIYYVRAYATNSAGTAYGNEISFTTLASTVPVLSTTAAGSITDTTAISGGNISTDGGSLVTARGVCWGTAQNPTVENNKTSDNSGVGEFTSNITGLKHSTLYYIRAYATNSTGTAYGPEVSFITKAAKPTISTSEVSNIGSNSATVGGMISSDGGAAVIARGICWSTAPNPTISNNKLAGGTGPGTFSINLTGLLPTTLYYVRAYATNNSGTAYGAEVSFTTTLTPAVTGHVTYTLAKNSNPTAEEQNAYNLITLAMDSAVWYYNHYTTFTKVLYVSYVPGVPTADGSNSGSIRFGTNTAYMQKATAMHEIMHTVGVGQNSSWTSFLMIGGVYQGTQANAMLRSITGNVTDVIHGDGWHFWPYGLNYESEYKSTADLINHCKIVNAMKLDGL
jgi:hypothetical protein